MTIPTEPDPTPPQPTLKTPLLDWPGRGARAYNVGPGWYVGEDPGSLQLRLGSASPDDLRHHPFKAMIVSGQRVAALEVLRERLGPRVGLAYLDLPRLSMAAMDDEGLRLPTWLTVVESHIASVRGILAKGAALVTHIDDEGAAYVRIILDDLFGHAAREATVLWQKKYSPQNDLYGRVDDAHDFLFVYRPRETFSHLPGAGRGRWWPYTFAGKTEDATREVEQLRSQGLVTLAQIPKTSKPEQLIRHLLETFGTSKDLVLEVFSDTAFASAAAVSVGRPAVLLAGDTATERAHCAQCCKGRLVAELQKTGSSLETDLLELEVDLPTQPKRAGITLRDSAVHLGPPRQAVGRVSSLGSIISAPRTVRIEPGTVLDARLGFPALSIKGPRLETLSAVEPVVRAEASTVLLDVDPPPETQEPSGYSWTRWISALQDNLDAARRLLNSDGSVVLALDEQTYAMARVVAEGSIGRECYAGTIAIDTNDMPEEPVTLRYYAIFQPLVGTPSKKIGLPANRQFVNPDSDPRGPWRDPGHKGARSGGKNTAFTYLFPPYRWQLVSGELPPGVWRINPVSGVIWGPSLEREGVYRFVARATDSRGASAEAECEIEVRADGDPERTETVWWLAAQPAAGGAFKVKEGPLPRGLVGRPYSAVLTAQGGKPHEGSTVPGKPTSGGNRTRYWEFADHTLEASILEDDVIFGDRGDSKPRIKRRPDHSGRWSVSVELSWWDATRLNGETAGERLAKIVSAEDDLLIVATSRTPAEFLPTGGSRRILRVHVEPQADQALPQGSLDGPVGRYDPETRVLDLDYASQEFRSRLAWLEGFLPAATVTVPLPKETGALLDGVAPGHGEACVMLSPEEWPGVSRVRRVAERLHPYFSRLVIYYFRGKAPLGLAGIEFRRVPFDLTCRPRA